MAVGVVCLDTNVLSWMFRTCRDKQDDMIARADALLESLKKSKAAVAIPSIVLAEALAFIDDERVQDFLNEINKSFFVLPFNELAAYHYSRIARFQRDVQMEGARWSKSADIKIIATAIAGGATCIYSEDPHVLKLSEGFLKARGLPPPLPKQMTLPMIPIS